MYIPTDNLPRLVGVKEFDVLFDDGGEKGLSKTQS